MDRLSARAVQLDPSDPTAWDTRSYALAWQQRWPEAMAASDKAIELLPYRPGLVSSRAVLDLLTGRQPEAEARLLHAVAMNPPGSSMEFRHLCFVRLMMGRYAEALPDCEKSAALDQWFEDQMLLTALYALRGDRPKTEIAKAQLLKAMPGLTIADSYWSLLSTDPTYRQQLEQHAHKGLRLAGIPER
jgi:tetratricopeptide (TPR) repeat protein